jgi:hypothetical protein
MSDETTPQDDKAMSPASAGSHGESQLERGAEIVHCAMRWYREGTTKKWQGGNSYAEDRARLAARRIARIFQPTLTDEEREAVEWAEELAGNCEEFDRVDTLRNLLERTK